MHSLINTIQALGQSSNIQASAALTTKAIAENIFKDLRSHGMRDKDIVAISSELLGRLTVEIKARQVSPMEQDVTK